MIKQFDEVAVALPRIGIVRKGAPKPEGKPGKDLEYFRFITPHAAVMAAWKAAIGERPTSISGILPYADPNECLSQWDELWVGSRMMWRGDGERLYIELKGDRYVSYADGEGPMQPAPARAKIGKNMVGRVSRLRLLMPQLGMGGIVEVLSTSPIDADELWSNLGWIRGVVATLQGAPVTVFRSPRTFQIPKPDGGEGTMKTVKHMLGMMLDRNYMDQLLPKPALPDRALVALPVSVGKDAELDVVLSGDDDDDDAAVWEEALPDTLDLFLEQAATRPGVDAINFAPNRLRSWVNYVTDGIYQAQYADLLFEVLDAYCSVVEVDRNHTLPRAERAQASYRAKIEARMAETELFVSPAGDAGIQAAVDDGTMAEDAVVAGREAAAAEEPLFSEVGPAEWVGGDDGDGQRGLMIMNSMGHPNG